MIPKKKNSEIAVPTFAKTQLNDQQREMKGRLRKTPLTFIDVERLLGAAEVIRRVEGGELLCVGCAAKLRGVTFSTINKAISRGKLRTFTLCCGSRIYVSREDLTKLRTLPANRKVKELTIEGILGRIGTQKDD